MIDIKQSVNPVNELAQKANVSTRTVYKHAKRLGRLPTVEEIKEAGKKTGRPRKYNY